MYIPRWLSLIVKEWFRRKKTEPKKKLFQGQSARPKNCFDLDIGCVEEKFNTRRPKFYKRLF